MSYMSENVTYCQKLPMWAKIQINVRYLPMDIIRITGQFDQNDVIVQEVVTHENSSNTSPGIDNGYGVALSKEKVWSSPRGFSESSCVMSNVTRAITISSAPLTTAPTIVSKQQVQQSQTSVFLFTKEKFQNFAFSMKTKSDFRLPPKKWARNFVLSQD